MSALAAPTLEEVGDAAMRAAIAEDAADGFADSLWLRILARKPRQGVGFYRFLRQAGWEGNVDHRLKEIIRVRLCRLAGDPYFSNLRSGAAREAGLSEERIEAGCGDVDNDASFSEAERWAIRYADLMFRDNARLDAAFYDGLKQHYSEPQVMELGAWAALVWGLAGWFCTLGLYPEHGRDGAPLDQTAAARLYGPVPTREAGEGASGGSARIDRR